MPDHDPPADAPRLAALTVDQVATLLQHAGSQMASAEVIQADIATGAPVNQDGTINVVAYAAWLVRELARREKAHA